MTKEPKDFRGIMVSSTFTDLEEHREGVTAQIAALGYMPVVMEHSGATPTDVISRSLEMVADCAAYVLLISHKYGRTPKAKSNPKALSITELEFNEAVKLGRPRLLFVMAEDHPTTRAQVELDPVKQTKLEAFKTRAKLADPDDPDSDLACIYQEFSSPADLAKKATVAIARLTERMPGAWAPALDDDTFAAAGLPPVPRPNPPALRAIPPYGASHRFVGRRAELETLDDWASPNDPNPILLFEAIGGAGKSMLTWHWLNSPDHAAAGDWAGRFWYSFYEQGATLTQFCWEALSYISGYPVEVFREMRAPELAERLLAELNARRWLLVLDGIERILVGYHRLDAPQMRDEEAGSATDQIADRDPCLSVRPDNDDLLRRLAQISGSKLLVSSRLTPAVFIDRAGPAIDGVRRELLKGLRPPDALALFRAYGVEGPEAAMQAFLQANCDGHPLTVGALAGLVNAYPRDHGDFIKWRDDPRYGGALNLADCELVQKRNHILDAAIDALAPKTRELLQGLAILRGGADYDLLLAINPFLPREPNKVAEPEHPEKEWSWIWNDRDEDWRKEMLAEYDRASRAYKDYLTELAAWQANPAVKSAPRHLDKALADLEKRGLLQFDRATHRYDLHPVVRGVASGRMRVEDIEASGTRVVDYCQAKSPLDWDGARTLADVELGLQTVSALLRMRRFEKAFDVLRGSLVITLGINLEANEQALALLRGFFPDGLDQAPALSSSLSQSYILNETALMLGGVDRERERSLYQRAIKIGLENGSVSYAIPTISNLAAISSLATQRRLRGLNLALAYASGDSDQIFRQSLHTAWESTLVGDHATASEIFADLAQRSPPRYRGIHCPGDLELPTTFQAYYLGTLTEAELTKGEEVAREGNTRQVRRQFVRLRGRWLLDQGRLDAAITALQTAITMSRDVGKEDRIAEAALALAHQRQGDNDLQLDPARWDLFGSTAALYIAWFWQERGDRDRAVAAATRVFRDAHDPGEPFVHRWEADQARALLVSLGETPPDIPPYDPATDTPYPWEEDVRALIDKLEAEKAANEARRGAKPKPKPRRRKPPG